MKYYTHSELEHIWHQVPLNYYQNGVRNNVLQKIWHVGKLKNVKNAIFQYKRSPRKILDIGCASGWFLSRLKHYFPKATCVGVDVYKEAILYGKKRYPYLRLHHADGHTLSFPNNSVDVIVCCEMLEHVENPKKVLLEIKRILSKDGIAVVEMDTGNVLFQIVWFCWTHLKHGVWKDAHIQTFNTKKLENIIKQNGFTILKRSFFNFSMAVVFIIEKN